MNKILKKLRALKFISWILMIAVVVLSLVSLFEGKKTALGFVFLFFAGIIGLYSHDILSSLHERIRKLEDINKIDNIEQ